MYTQALSSQVHLSQEISKLSYGKETTKLVCLLKFHVPTVCEQPLKPQSGTEVLFSLGVTLHATEFCGAWVFLKVTFYNDREFYAVIPIQTMGY